LFSRTQAGDVLHIEGHDFTQSWDLLLESRHRSVEERLQQARIQEAQFLGEPIATRKRLFEIKAIRAASIEHQVEAQLDDEQGMHKPGSGAVGSCT
jgi:hypothetical protein